MSRKTKSGWGKVFGVFFLLVIAVFGVAYWQLGAIVKSVVQEVGTRFVGVPVSVDTVLLSPLSGNGSMRGFRVANPSGFSGKHAFEVGQIALGIDAKSLLSDKVIIRRIHLSSIALEYEGNGAQNNLARLQQNIERNTKRYRDPSSDSKTASSSKRSYLIEDFWIKDVKVTARQVLPVMGAKVLELSIPDIRLKNISDSSSEEVTREISRKVAQAVTDAVMKNISGSLQDTAKQLLEKAGAGKGKELLEKSLKQGLNTLFGK